jgi:hypothetical protein
VYLIELKLGIKGSMNVRQKIGKHVYETIENWYCMYVVFNVSHFYDII